MKWLVVILVILNIAIYLLGQKLDPEAPGLAVSGEYETVNPELMSIIEPGRNETSAGDKASDGQMLEEEGLAQLKMDTRGQVLMAPTVAPKLEEEGPAPIIVAGDPSQSRQVAEERSPAQPAEPADVEQAPASDSPSMPEPVAAPEKPALSCYRLGPFGNQTSLASARRKLEKQGIAYSVDEDRGNQKIKAIRVYLDIMMQTHCGSRGGAAGPGVVDGVLACPSALALSIGR